MLMIEVPETEAFNEETNEFQKIKGVSIQLEHSLVSLSKWESKWKKPFLSSEKTTEQTLDYIKCMTINHNIPDYIYPLLTNDILKQIMDYISDSMTATTFPINETKHFNRRIITAELIYYWMIAQNIPFECRKWHLNKLMTLIRVCALESQPPKKMSKAAIMSQNRSLNAARKARLNSKG